MSDIDSTSSTSSELSAGFSTPPSSSLDTCDSGFNDLYSNSFTILSSAGSSKCSRTTPAQIDQSDSSPEPAEQLLFDENSITATETQTQLTTSHNKATDDDKQTGAATAVDRPPPSSSAATTTAPDTPSPSTSSSLVQYNNSNDTSSSPNDDAQFDLTSLDYKNQHTTNACARDTPPSVGNAKYSGDNDADDYNEDSNMSDLSDLSDVFKLNSDIMPEMQRSIDWVSQCIEHKTSKHLPKLTHSDFLSARSPTHTIHHPRKLGAHANRIRCKSTRLPITDICK